MKDKVSKKFDDVSITCFGPLLVHVTVWPIVYKSQFDKQPEQPAIFQLTTKFGFKVIAQHSLRL